MAQPDRMNGKRWIDSDYRLERKKELKYSCTSARKHHATADELKSITVPGQTKSIKEMMKRYEQGRPIPTIE